MKSFYSLILFELCMMDRDNHVVILLRNPCIVVGTPTITIDNVHKHRHHHRYLDADSISLISSSAAPHIYQCKFLLVFLYNLTSYDACRVLRSTSKDYAGAKKKMFVMQPKFRRKKSSRLYLDFL